MGRDDIARWHTRRPTLLPALIIIILSVWPLKKLGGSLATCRPLSKTIRAVGSIVLDVVAQVDMIRTDGFPRRIPEALECTDVTVRVAKAIGSRGYSQARISSVCRLPDSAEVVCPLVDPSATLNRSRRVGFDYCEPFLHKWENFHLSTSIVDLHEGTQSLLMDHARGPVQLNVTLPPIGAGVRGIIVGDPCISSRYLPGLCHQRWDVRDRLPRLLNAIAENDGLDFIIILGDAFYDARGELTAEFWQRLSPKVQQAFLLAVPGNHDLWIIAPWAPLPQDQLGIGFLQWYGQDTSSSLAGGSAPYQLAASGRKNSAGSNDAELMHLPAAENFFFYHILGNVGFIGFSGAHSRDEQEPLFREACSYFTFHRPMAIYLLGHWNEPGLGCQPGMDVPAVFDWLTSGPCAPVADSMRYMMGHIHCNEQMEDGRGYVLGASGATGKGCRTPREWGFGYLDTRSEGKAQRRSDSHWLGKFTVATDTFDNGDALEECIRTRGTPRDCIGFGETWVNDIAGVPATQVLGADVTLA